MKISVVFVFLLSVLASVAHADDTLRDVYIKSIQTGWGGEGIYFEIVGTKRVEGCAEATVFIADSPMLDRILSIGLSAQQTKTDVDFRISGCHGNGMRGVAIAIGD